MAIVHARACTRARSARRSTHTLHACLLRSQRVAAGALDRYSQWEVWSVWPSGCIGHLCRSELLCAFAILDGRALTSPAARAFSPAVPYPARRCVCVCACPPCPPYSVGTPAWAGSPRTPSPSGPVAVGVLWVELVFGHVLRRVSRMPARCCLAAWLSAPARAVRAAACELPSRQVAPMRQRRSACIVCAGTRTTCRPGTPPHAHVKAGGAASRGVSPRCPGPVPVTGGGYAT